MKMQDIIDLGFVETRELTPEQRTKVYNRMVATANTRIKNLEKYYNKKSEKTGKFEKSPIPSLELRRNKKADSLEYDKFQKKDSATVQDIYTMQKFLRAKSSTVAGIRDVTKQRDANILKLYNKVTGLKAKGLTREQYDEIGDILERMNDLRDNSLGGKEVYPEEFRQLFSVKNAIKLNLERDSWYETYTHKSGKLAGKQYKHKVYESYFDAWKRTLEDKLAEYTQEDEITVTLADEHRAKQLAQLEAMKKEN